jgi:type I phosphodiesterase/nucleotide pyrophosphatase
MRIRMKAALAGCALWLGCNAQPAPTVGTQASADTVDYGHGRHTAKTSHVLLLSIDGFHDFDLANYVASHPHSALALLTANGTTYTNAWSTGPSDSFPATLAMTTGGSPSSTGIYYDATWDDSLSPPGSDCSHLGTAVTYKENINFVTNSGSTAADINPALLPRDPANGCAPVYPHSYLKVNTIYEVIHAAGMRTATTDKHPAYEMLNGPSGTGLDDFYGPEFNGGKKDIAKTMANDDLRLNAVLHQLDGCDHTGADCTVGVPAILGMNFQGVNIAQKFSGYLDAAGSQPNNVYVIGANTGKAPGLQQAMDHADASIQMMLDKINANGLADSTVVMMAAKHGNSPVDYSTFRAVNPDTTFKPLIDANFGAGTTGTVTADTMALIWLTDHSKQAEVGDYLRANIATFGGGTVYVGSDIDALVGGQMAGNPGRHPDIIVTPDDGVVYTTVGSKICDHGGLRDQDRHVAMVVAGGKFHPGSVVDSEVTLQMVAPTILKALGLKEHDLDAVNFENTHRLPDGDDGDDGVDDITE